MATYKGIKGVKVVTKASDPTASEAEGTVWYNSSFEMHLNMLSQVQEHGLLAGALNTGKTYRG